MSSDWAISELGKEAINASRPFSFKKHPDVVFVNTGDVLNGSFLHANLSAGEGLPGQAKKALRLNDILLTEIRPGNGRFAYVDFDAQKYVVSTKFMVIESLGRVSPRFLYHVLTNQAALDEFQQIAESRSGTFPQITFDSIAHYPVPVPPEHEQRKLVEFLDALGLKITLLREINATLEAMAQAIFKSWFVDFDPVRAKAEGRQPERMDAETAALFPDSFEESELGLVPKGWKYSTIGQSFILTMGQSPPGDTYNEEGEGVPFYQGRTDFGLRFPTRRIFCTAPTRLAKAGDTLVSVRAPVGDVNTAIEPCALGRGVASVRHSEGLKGFTFYSIRGLKKHFDLYDKEGTVFGAINKKDFQSLSIVLPDNAVLRSFESIVAPLDSAIELNEREIRSLSQLRDTLLPKLMSGEIRLPEAEEIISAAVSA